MRGLISKRSLRLSLAKIANQNNHVPNIECDNTLAVSARQERPRDPLTIVYINSELYLQNTGARSAVAKVNEGAKILVDLFYRLSLSRRAQIKPAFNLLAKATVDAIPADSLLFGTSFSKEMKKASAMEKSSKDIIKMPLVVSKKVLQPIKQPDQVAPSKVGNLAPLHREQDQR
ncbi:PREDICTED: uncharacterized protein LOC105143757 [Acromyrmex echinatior]|uniref:uncharacterized protein LOC105143757 n=1 Tax=Acromyrmex echinatior TaxID=103372 RepID=UPI000580D8CD|nr:PREDICTED: uncharacterized protein LOC105143757 [Acromyrmex echinatior]